MLEPSLERGQRGHQPAPAWGTPGSGARAIPWPHRQQEGPALPPSAVLAPGAAAQIPIFSDISGGISSTALGEDTLSVIIKWNKNLYPLLRVLLFVLWFGL